MIDLQEEAKRRLLLLAKAKWNEQFQSFEYSCCKNDILYWFSTYVYTDKNKNLFSWWVDVIPFIPFEFQKEAITEIWASIVAGTDPVLCKEELTNVFIEKSRQMGISWVVMAIFTYWYVFHNHKYHCISQKEDDVDQPGNMKSLMEKSRFILNNLPKWMLPPWYDKKIGSPYNKHLVISRSDGTGAITGESANANAWRWGSYDGMFLDEFASTAYANQINTSCSSATSCRIFNSTPKGEGNEFFRMRKFSLWSKDEDWKDVAPEIKGLRYHWSEHPLYDEKWYKWKIKGMSPEKIAQELEIDYNTALEWRVYKDFPKQAEKVVYDPVKQLYIWIDNSHWWVDPHAVVVAQIDTHYINIIDSIEVNSSPQDMAEYLAWIPKFQMNNSQLKFLERWKTYNRSNAIYISDPYDTHTKMGNSTIYDDYSKVWIKLQIPYNRDKKQQIQQTKANIYRLRYNDYCLDYASSMMNARYPEIRESSNRTWANDKPVHDWTSHFRTATEYGITYLQENPIIKKTKVAQDNRPWKILWKISIDQRTKKYIRSNNTQARRSPTGKLIYS